MYFHKMGKEEEERGEEARESRAALCCVYVASRDANKPNLMLVSTARLYSESVCSQNGYLFIPHSLLYPSSVMLSLSYCKILGVLLYCEYCYLLPRPPYVHVQLSSTLRWRYLCLNLSFFGGLPGLHAVLARVFSPAALHTLFFLSPSRPPLPPALRVMAKLLCIPSFSLSRPLSLQSLSAPKGGGRGRRRGRYSEREWGRKRARELLGEEVDRWWCALELRLFLFEAAEEKVESSRLVKERRNAHS